MTIFITFSIQFLRRKPNQCFFHGVPRRRPSQCFRTRNFQSLILALGEKFSQFYPRIYHLSLRGTKFSNRGWRHRQSWFFAKCFSFREHFNDGERRKLSETFCACFFVLDLKCVITNVTRKVFFQHDMRAGTSTDLFQNNKICTTSRSKICSGDVHVLNLFPIFTSLLKYCATYCKRHNI